MGRYTLRDQFNPLLVVINNNPRLVHKHEMTDEIAEIAINGGVGLHCFNVVIDELPEEKKVNNHRLGYFQIFYDQQSKRNCYEDSIRLDNNLTDEYFESSAILKCFEQHKDSFDYFAILSHRFGIKTGHNILMQPQNVQNIINEQEPEMIIFQNHKDHDTIALADNTHPKFRYIWNYIHEKIGYPTHHEKYLNVIYANQFCMKKELYQKFVNYLKAAIEVMSNKEDVELQSLLWVDSGYKPNYKYWRENLKRKLGIDYYPMHPFVLERFITNFTHFYVKNIISL